MKNCIKIRSKSHIFYRKFSNFKDAVNYVSKNMTIFDEAYIGNLTDKYYFRLSKNETLGSITTNLIKAAIKDNSLPGFYVKKVVEKN